MTAIRVDCIDDDGHLVRGDAHLTEVEARDALAMHYIERLNDYAADCFIGTVPEAREAVKRYDLRCTLGLYRKIPCICGGGHKWDMAPADGPGRGAFRAAYLEYVPRAVAR